jgi:hypothetical protein
MVASTALQQVDIDNRAAGREENPLSLLLFDIRILGGAVSC